MEKPNAMRYQHIALALPFVLGQTQCTGVRKTYASPASFSSDCERTVHNCGSQLLSLAQNIHVGESLPIFTW